MAQKKLNALLIVAKWQGVGIDDLRLYIRKKYTYAYINIFIIRYSQLMSILRDTAVRHTDTESAWYCTSRAEYVNVSSQCSRSQI